MLEHFCIVTFLHSENWRHKFTVDSVFWTFPLIQFSLSPLLSSVSTLRHCYARTFLRSDLSALGKLETQIYCRFSFPNFSIGSVSPSPLLSPVSTLRHCYARTFLCSDLSALGKLETQIYRRFSFPNFSIGSVFPITHLKFRFDIYAWPCIKHSCMDIYAWWPFCTSKKCQKKSAKTGSHIYAWPW